MSERKTAEIKFRCTPTFKAAVQAQAEAEGVSASQLLENAANNHIWGEANKKLDGTALVGNAITLLEPTPTKLLDTNDITMIIAESWDDEDGAPAPPRVFIDAGADDPALLNPDGPVVCNCRPWEFCTHKTNA